MSRLKNLLLSYFFVTGLGVLLHFTYNWSGQNPFVGIFSAVNESIWEHLKLIYYPMLLLTIWKIFKKRKNGNDFLPARTIGILSAMAFTIIAYYTYSGVLGQNIDFINIAIYFMSILVGFWIEKNVYGKIHFLKTQSSVVILLILFFLFLIFTYSPPDIGLFLVPDL